MTSSPNWLTALLQKLPSLKGITAFFYVATHWSTISHDFEVYRQQIEDRERWLKTDKERYMKEIEYVKSEAARDLAASEKEKKLWQCTTRQAIDFYAEAVTLLAIMFKIYPSDWKRLSPKLDPIVRERVELIMTKLPFLSPPPPLPPPLPLGLRLPKVGDLLTQDPQGEKRLKDIFPNPPSLK